MARPKGTISRFTMSPVCVRESVCVRERDSLLGKIFHNEGFHNGGSRSSPGGKGGSGAGLQRRCVRLVVSEKNK